MAVCHANWNLFWCALRRLNQDIKINLIHAKRAQNSHPAFAEISQYLSDDTLRLQSDPDEKNVQLAKFPPFLSPTSPLLPPA